MNRPRWQWIPLYQIGLILILILTITFLVQPTFTSAQLSTTELDYRVRRLENEVTDLKGRISQLQFRGAGTLPQPPLPENPDSTTPAPPPPSDDPMFDRLATLVIELKQDVINLQERVEKLENPSN